MVISDGAPVDDSTLSTNTSDYLESNLKKTVKWIENKSNIELLAIGIGHDVTRYYNRAVKITDVQDLGDVMINQLTDLFAEKNKKTLLCRKKQNFVEKNTAFFYKALFFSTNHAFFVFLFLFLQQFEK